MKKSILPLLIILFVLVFISCNEFFEIQEKYSTAKENFLSFKNEHFDTFITVTIAVIVAIVPLFWMAFTNRKRYLNQKRVYATNMIREWNYHCIRDTQLINHHFDGYYATCKVIPKEEIKIKVKEKPALAVALKRLFNYFEYVAIAYRHTANRKIIKESFSLTIIRYTRVLQNYLLMVQEDTKRNHWVTVTKFIANLYKHGKHKSNPCKLCSSSEQSMKCYLKDSNFNKILAILND